MVEREGRLTGYASGFGYFGHAVGESNMDLQALLCAAEVSEGSGLLFLHGTGWRVIVDVTISISKNLLVKPETRASDLRKVVSHPEALKACASWLKANVPQLPREDVSSRYCFQTSRTTNTTPRTSSSSKPPVEISRSKILIV